MSDEPGLLSTILEAPEEALRLVFADWLDDHGKPERAEFIRVQIELARLPADDARRPALALREAELWARHGEALRRGLPKWAHQGAAFHRGIPTGLC